MLEAGLWAALGQSALLVGALLVARFPKLTEPRWLGLVMAFGAGALISAITTDLVVPAYDAAGRAPAGIGLLVGAVGYYALTTWLNRRSEREDPEEPVEEAEDLAGDTAVPSGADATAARNLTVGMVLDGIPESIAIGLTLLGGGTVSVRAGRRGVPVEPARCHRCRRRAARGWHRTAEDPAAVRGHRARRLRCRTRGLRNSEAQRGRPHRHHPDHRRGRDGRGVRQRDGADRSARRGPRAGLAAAAGFAAAAFLSTLG